MSSGDTPPAATGAGGGASWDDLRVFEVVAREASFTRAAAVLWTSQPALSRRMSKLESRLQVRLFDRGPRQTTLTEAGRVLLARVEQMTRMWAGALTDLAELRGARRSPLRLSTEWVAGIPDVVADLEDRWGRPVVHSRGSAYEQIPRLLAGDLDIVQGFMVPTAPLEFEHATVVAIVREPVWVYLPPDHPLGGRCRERGGVDLAELAGEDWLATRLDRLEYEYKVGLCHRAGFSPRIAKVTDSLSLFTGAFASGRYVTMGTPMAPRTLRPAIALPLTSPLDRDGLPPARHGFLAWLPGALPDGATDHLTDTFRSWYTHLAQVRQPTYARHLATACRPGRADARSPTVAVAPAPGEDVASPTLGEPRAAGG